jgi:uncharacterized OsmC-like protein
VKISLIAEDALRVDPSDTPLTVETPDQNTQYSPFHMLASALATCIYSLLGSWAENAKLDSSDLAIEVEWKFAEDPHRVATLNVELDWPSLPDARKDAAERAARLCTVHATLTHPPEISVSLATRDIGQPG